MTPETATEIVLRACGERKCIGQLTDIERISVNNCIDGEISTGYIYSGCTHICPVCNGTGWQPITLPDVLMALGGIKYYSVYTDDLSNLRMLDIKNLDIICEWSLTTDFHGQSDDTKIAIAQLLTPSQKED